jgi:hypothetical protein
MEEEKGKQEMTETDARGDLNTVEGRRGPTWRGWVFSILVAVILSVTATLLLGGSGSFRSDRAAESGAAGGGSRSGTGSSCCPPADAGK